MTANKALIDEIVTNVLAMLQPAAAPSADSLSGPQPASVRKDAPIPAAAPSTVPATTDSKPAAVELLGPVITADMLDGAIRPGQTLRIGRKTILTPSARDWLNSRRTVWTRYDKAAGTASAGRGRWQIILQTVTPTVRSLQDGIRKLADGWKVDLVGQPSEAAALATNLISTADCDGVVIFTEHADLIACKANRNERVRAAVVHHPRQWEQVVSTLGANVVCISPVGRTFIELRNLLKECALRKPHVPAGW